MKHLLTAVLTAATATALSAGPIVKTDAYTWEGDTVFQGPYKAWTDDGRQLHSTYHAQPGYYMPVLQEWTVKNDISGYPQLTTPNKLHTAIYNLGLDEMVNAVEPDTTLRTGKEWAGVWTRDVSYSILLSMAYLQPEASKISLMRKVTPTGRIVQDTGSGGAWPVSSDRMVWALAAYEVYKVTGDRAWLEYIYPIIRDSMEDDLVVTHDADGLVRGETSFIDWREQSYPRWMQPADIYRSRALGTSVVHARALEILSEIAAELGHKAEAKKYGELAEKTARAVNDKLWLDDKGYYAMYDYGRAHPILNPRAETLGESLAILYDIAPADRARTITESNPTTPFGVGIFYPQIADMTPYHNNALWPWVGSYWALANAKARNEQGVMEAIGAVFRPAALFTTNKENFVLDNGDIATELNSSNMLWCLAGNLALTHRILFGIDYEKDGLALRPFVPEVLGATRTLSGFPYRRATLDITVSGYGDSIASCTLDGKKHAPFIPADIKPGLHKVDIVLTNNKLPEMKVNRQPNLKDALMPVAAVRDGVLSWRPVEYSSAYIVLRDGAPVDTVTTTTYPADVPGEYQVIAVGTNRDPHVQSFASEPVAVYEELAFEFPGESVGMNSPEVSYRPRDEFAGYHGRGFVETDHTAREQEVEIALPEDGTYAAYVVYANGNGPINTENKCAIRTIVLDGEAVGTTVMPHRGVANWNDWGRSSVVTFPAKAGTHRMGVSFRPQDENMNLGTNHALLDRIVIQKIK